jgi:hypothetical protein
MRLRAKEHRRAPAAGKVKEPILLEPAEEPALPHTSFHPKGSFWTCDLRTLGESACIVLSHHVVFPHGTCRTPIHLVFCLRAVFTSGSPENSVHPLHPPLTALLWSASRTEGLG